MIFRAFPIITFIIPAVFLNFAVIYFTADIPAYIGSLEISHKTSVRALAMVNIKALNW